MKTKKVMSVIIVLFLIIFISRSINNYAVEFVSDHKERENGILIGAEPYTIQKDPQTTVLLIHGTSSSPRDFKDMAEYLSNKGISIKAILLPGHGTSPEDLSTTSYQEWNQAVREELNSISSKNKFAIGYSLGGALALDLAEEKNLNGVIAIQTPIFLQNRYIPFIPLISIVQKYSVKPPESIMLGINDNTVRYDAIPLSAIVELEKLSTQLNLAQIKEPALIIQTNNDIIVHPRSANYIYDGISSKNKELIWLEASTHEKPNQKEAEEIFEEIYQFIKENSKL